MSLLKRRSQFYRMLATLEGAGLPRVRALEQSYPWPFDRAAHTMAALIGRQGVTLSEAMTEHPRLFSQFERSLVRVGEQTGRVEQVFRSLAEWYELVNRLRSQVIGSLLYPIFLYHFAAVAIPAISCIMGTATMAGAFRQMIGMLAVPYGLAFCWFVVKPALFPGGIPVAPAVARTLLAVPLLGTVAYKLNTTRFFRALGLALNAGMGAAAAVRLASSGCTNSFLRARALRVAEKIERRGCPFVEAFREELLYRERGSLIVAMMDTAEIAGSPDTMAEKIAQIYGEEAEELLKRIAKLGPVVLYLILAIYMAMQIIRFYASYFGQIQELLE